MMYKNHDDVFRELEGFCFKSFESVFDLENELLEDDFEIHLWDDDDMTEEDWFKGYIPQNFMTVYPEGDLCDMTFTLWLAYVGEQCWVVSVEYLGG